MNIIQNLTQILYEIDLYLFSFEYITKQAFSLYSKSFIFRYNIYYHNIEYLVQVMLTKYLRKWPIY